MILSEIAVRRPVFTTMVISAIVVFGLVSFQRLGIDLFPKVDIPIVSIVTVLKGADPETIETTVTDPIEEAVNTISGIKALRSTSAENVSQVVIEFELEKDVDVAYQEVQAKVGAVRSKLPADIESPVIEKFDPDSAPIMSVLVSGDMPIYELTRLADREVKQVLERVRDVGSVRMVGGRERKIWLWLDREKLDAHGLCVQDVQAALAREHIEMSGGRVETGPVEITVKTKAEFEDASRFNGMVISDAGGRVVRLRDVGYAEDGIEEERSFAAMDGRPAVSLLVRRQSGKNTVAVADAIKARVAELRDRLAPRGVEVAIAKDMSVFIRNAVHETEFHILYGGGLAVLIVMFFLRNLRSTLISALVIPTAIIGALILVHAMGFSLNMLTLLALSLSVGLLIDDSIVVQENTMRHVEEGKPSREAALFATDEIGLAVFATTMSVVAVFVPVAYMRGIVGRFFYPFALTVSFAVMISMFVSFTLDPMLSSRFLRRVEHPNAAAQAAEAFLRALDRLYGRILDAALRHRWTVLGIGFGALALSVYLASFVKSEFKPEEDQSEFNVQIRAPLGSSLDATRRIAEEVRRRIAGQPWVEYIYYDIGSDEMQRVNQAQMYVKMREKTGRPGVSQKGAMEWTRRAIAEIGGAIISVQEVQRIGGGGFRSALVQLDLRGPDLGVLADLSGRLVEELKKRPGYTDLDTTFEGGKPEAHVFLDRDRAADLGVPAVAVASTIRAAIGGLDAARFRAEGDRYDVAIRFLDRFRDRTGAIEEIKLRSASGRLVEMRSVATVRKAEGPLEINRYNRQRQITVMANLTRDEHGREKKLGDARKEIDAIVREIGLPPGYSAAWIGFAEIMEESFEHLFFALYLGVIVVYMVLAAQFESFVHPFTIMIALPFSIIGAIGGLLLAGQTLCIFSFIGIIMLMGLVTKNSILLIDYTNTLRWRDGLDRDAAPRRAGPVRLRPILMTTFAMIFGMLPVALGMGAGAETRQPMAVAVIGGLTTSTILTLVIVPVVYTLMDDLGAWLGRVFSRRHG
ncbi:MAG: efflux RND transporter permease subunit [Planctomycetota bacterium]|nr:efflux RND transporter permease subunit [Planctomycetota bacterium]